MFKCEISTSFVSENTRGCLAAVSSNDTSQSGPRERDDGLAVELVRALKHARELVRVEFPQDVRRRRVDVQLVKEQTRVRLVVRTRRRGRGGGTRASRARSRRSRRSWVRDPRSSRS